MRLLTVAACVTATLAAAPAFSLNRATTAGITDRFIANTLGADETVLVMGGASAARDAVRTEFNNMCVAGTFDVYAADDTAVTSGAEPDFRVYSCTLSAGLANIDDSIEGDNVVVFYRSEGGSVYGPGSVAHNAAIKALRVVNTTACTDSASTFPTVTETCTISNYDLGSDTETSGRLIDLNIQLAVSDEEPKVYRGVNWPTVGILAGLGEPAPGVLEGLSPQNQVFGQIFGIMVNTANPVTSLSKQDITAIFTGAYDNWSDVRATPNGAASVYPAGGAIKVCRREAGSGTQATAELYFMGQGCNSAAKTFLDEITNPPSGDTVLQHNSTTSSLEVCVGGDANAIGMNVFKSPAPANTKYIAIEGVAPSRENAAVGSYDYWYEATYTRRAGLSGRSLLLAQGLTTRAQQLASVPNNQAVIGLRLGGTNAFTAPVQSPTPVAYGTRNGNSCSTQAAGNSF
jgi:hypothetical protein